jgi:hypothetical protein
MESTEGQAWTAELWVPFSQLRFNRQDRPLWGLDVRRFTRDM